MSEPLADPQIVEFGPYRVIGLRYAGKGENGEMSALWGAEDGFIARMGEVESPPEAKWLDTDRHAAFGLCRCLPGATDGSLEYIAAVSARADAPIPPVMVEAQIPACTYAAFPVHGLENLMDAWAAIPDWLAAHPEWEGYCTGPGEDCDCENHPAFELYPPDFGLDQQMFVYVPVKPKKA